MVRLVSGPQVEYEYDGSENGTIHVNADGTFSYELPRSNSSDATRVTFEYVAVDSTTWR